MRTTRLSLPGCLITASEEWRDITETLNTPDLPFTLAKDDGVGALQFTVARYRAGPAPNAGVEQLSGMLDEFATSHSLQSAFDRSSHAGYVSRVAASFQRQDDFVRVWYLSDGRSFLLVTYVCTWESRSNESEECETMVASIRFDR